jgi:hypothetical protein
MFLTSPFIDQGEFHQLRIAGGDREVSSAISRTRLSVAGRRRSIAQEKQEMTAYQKRPDKSGGLVEMPDVVHGNRGQ